MANIETPFDYTQINVYNSSYSPSTVHSSNTEMTRYFAKYLLQKAVSVFDVTMPKTWEKGYVMYTLLCQGYFAIMRTAKYGIIPQNCTLNGRGVMYQPTRAIISNPIFTRSFDLRLWEQCGLVRLQPDYSGIWDIISYYADLMAVTSEGIGINILNTRLAYVFACENKKMAESFKKMYDQIIAGNPAVFGGFSMFDGNGNPNWQMFNQNLDQVYIADRMLVDLQKIEDEFNTLIGIPNANTEKRERMIVDEVNANNMETRALSEVWLEQLQNDCERCNELFGERVIWFERRGGVESAKNDAINNGAV